MVITNENTLETETKSSRTKITLIKPISSLNTLSYAFNEFSSPTIANLDLVNFQRRKYSSNELVIGAMAHLPFYSKLQGVSFGLGYKKKINAAFFFNGMIAYSRNVYEGNIISSRSSLDGSPIAEVNMDPHVNIDYSNVELENNLGELKAEYFDIAANKIRNLNYVSIPIDIQYQISVRNSIGLGIQYSYLLNRSFDQSINEASFNVNELLDSSFNPTLSYENKHNLNFTGIYRYRLNQKLDLKCILNYGLNTILRTNEQIGSRNNINYLGFGVDYKLKM